LLVLYPDVLLRRIPQQQLFPRIEDVLVCTQDRDQRTEGQAALDHEVAADRVEEERRHLCEEVVEELDEELASVDGDAEAEDRAEPVADVGGLEMKRVVAADFGGTGHRFADAI